MSDQVANNMSQNYCTNIKFQEKKALTNDPYYKTSFSMYQKLPSSVLGLLKKYRKNLPHLFDSNDGQSNQQHLTA